MRRRKTPTRGAGIIPGPLDWRRRWPDWAGYAASGWAVAHGGAVLAGIGRGNRYRGVPGGRWVAGGVLAASAVAAAASVRPWGRRMPSPAVSTGMWGSTAVTGAGSAFLLLYLLELAVKGTVTDRDRNTDWPGFADRLSWTAGAALFTGASIAWRRRTRDVCVYCGKDHPDGDVAGVEYPTPEPPKPWVRYLAYAGCAGLTPYAVMHLLVANGRQPFGLKREDIIEGGAGGAWLEMHGIPWVDIAAGLGGFLLLGLTHPWGERFPGWTMPLAGHRVPRFLPLIPAWVTGPTLAIYGIVGGSFTALAAAGLARGDWEADRLRLAGVAMTAFGTFGTALTVAAWSYQQRTRPHCVLAPAVVDQVTAPPVRVERFRFLNVGVRTLRALLKMAATRHRAR
ncbi:hypothetical protein O7634_29035 [Micromonospora sp. WMMD1120]|uniref:hypothetical protein n=1 Tax=Micromonospora sp. WMMD1120 TaxID=3016106 RepID=UPI002416D328|nr:hypothetical protein [Micromonospora sp. WMMD1120]MDG4810821.1 hypothetical protein [Micromonospora sp. WMMD1120]